MTITSNKQVGAIEVVKRLRDDWRRAAALCEPTFDLERDLQLSKVVAANEIIKELESLAPSVPTQSAVRAAVDEIMEHFNSIDIDALPQRSTIESTITKHLPVPTQSAGWQPIETAPKDDDEVLLWIPSDECIEIADWREDAKAWDTRDGWLRAEPSHWMRPAPPVSTSEGE